LEIDILSLMGMEGDNDVDEDEGEVMQDAKDLIMLEEWRAQRDRHVVEDDGVGVENGYVEDLRELDHIDSDDDYSDDEPTTAGRGDNF
jgi:hypothetical protein